MKDMWFKMKKSSFVEGTFIATFAIIFVKLLGMLYVIPFYAIVGTAGAALYAYAYNIYNVFLDISTVGLPIAISKITNEYNTLKMYDAKKRAYKIAINLMRFVSITIFIILFIFAKDIAYLIIGDLSGGNNIEDITSVIRWISLAILVIPYLSVTKGYLQGHNVINISSISNVLEQVVRIAVILIGSYLAIKVFHGSYVLGVKIALTGAFFGGLVAYSFVRYKMYKNKEELSLEKTIKKDNITNKEIIKKITSYAIPYIIINSITSLYSFIDMILVIKALTIIGYETTTLEFIATSISTWSTKINMIIISIAMGMTISLIPAIVNSFTLKKWDEVNHKVNTSLKMITFISVPMAIGLSFLSNQVWALFYGPSDIGATILSLSVFVGMFTNYFMISSSIMQSINSFKIVYIATITGFVLNALLDIPLMLLFNKIGIPPYLGALVASIIGYLTSVLISLLSLKKKEKKISYQDFFHTSLKIIVPSTCLIIVLIILRLIPTNLDNNFNNLVFVLFNALIGMIVYFGVSYKMHIIDEVFGKEYINKLLKKLNFKVKH